VACILLVRATTSGSGLVIGHANHCSSDWWLNHPLGKAAGRAGIYSKELGSLLRTAAGNFSRKY